MRCDLHGCKLIEAKDELLLKLEECQMKGDQLLEVVHGHHGGTVLRDYVRSQKFLEEATRNGFHVNFYKIFEKVFENFTTFEKKLLSTKTLYKDLVRVSKFKVNYKHNYKQLLLLFFTTN